MPSEDINDETLKDIKDSCRARANAHKRVNVKKKILQTKKPKPKFNYKALLAEAKGETEEQNTTPPERKESIDCSDDPVPTLEQTPQYDPLAPHEALPAIERRIREVERRRAEREHPEPPFQYNPHLLPHIFANAKYTRNQTYCPHCTKTHSCTKHSRDHEEYEKTAVDLCDHIEMSVYWAPDDAVNAKSSWRIGTAEYLRREEEREQHEECEVKKACDMDEGCWAEEQRTPCGEGAAGSGEYVELERNVKNRGEENRVAGVWQNIVKSLETLEDYAAVLKGKCRVGIREVAAPKDRLAKKRKVATREGEVVESDKEIAKPPAKKRKLLRNKAKAVDSDDQVTLPNSAKKRKVSANKGKVYKSEEFVKDSSSESETENPIVEKTPSPPYSPSGSLQALVNFSTERPKKRKASVEQGAIESPIEALEERPIKKRKVLDEQCEVVESVEETAHQPAPDAPKTPEPIKSRSPSVTSSRKQRSKSPLSRRSSASDSKVVKITPQQPTPSDSAPTTPNPASPRSPSVESAPVRSSSTSSSRRNSTEQKANISKATKSRNVPWVPEIEGSENSEHSRLSSPKIPLRNGSLSPISGPKFEDQEGKGEFGVVDRGGEGEVDYSDGEFD
ncbi:hypothetical protein N0V90_001949 [Kalmusia sp. IMI 367209]|nr:hypothetical protein N0V90_001949 [Kalmusia sp. IMI 367209]